jgi:hypothetical protein
LLNCATRTEPDGFDRTSPKLRRQNDRRSQVEAQTGATRVTRPELVKEAENNTPEHPNRPMSAHRNFVTEAGLATIEAALGRFEAAHRAATDKGDREAAAVALREVRYWSECGCRQTPY